MILNAHVKEMRNVINNSDHFRKIFDRLFIEDYGLDWQCLEKEHNNALYCTEVYFGIREHKDKTMTSFDNSSLAEYYLNKSKAFYSLGRILDRKPQYEITEKMRKRVERKSEKANEMYLELINKKV